MGGGKGRQRSVPHNPRPHPHLLALQHIPIHDLRPGGDMRPVVEILDLRVCAVGVVRPGGDEGDRF